MDSNLATAFVAAPLCRGDLDRPARSIPARAPECADGIPMLSVFTLVSWLSLLGAGIVGFAVGYVRPEAAPAVPPPVVAEVIEVALTEEPLPPIQLDPVLPASEVPPILDPVIAPPETVAMIPVAEPSAAVAFALPVEGPVRVVKSTEASYVVPAEPAVRAAPAPPVQTLVYGRGEGRQPAPPYPRRAIQEGQEGTTTIRFTVGENGRVLQAQSIAPCPWPLLNEAALSTVRRRWHFQEGPVRAYEVAIRFQLRK